MNHINKLLNENLYLHHREHYLYGLLLRKTVVARLLLYEPRPLMESEWDVLYQEMNLLHEHFMEHLSEGSPSLKEEEIQSCCLLKLGLSAEEAAQIVGITIQKVLHIQQKFSARLQKTP